MVVVDTMFCLSMTTPDLLGFIPFILKQMFFLPLLKTLVECKIKQLQYDNGGEYISKQFTSFLDLNGIHYHLTHPYTS